MSHPESHATTTCRAQLDCTTAEDMVRFDRADSDKLTADLMGAPVPETVIPTRGQLLSLLAAA
jgi:hypothetical protein